MKRRIKAFLGRAIFASRAYLPLFRNRAVIVLFHRVDDRYPGDPITCSTAQFREFCTFFHRYFTVVPFHDLIAKLERGDDISRHLVITFDDGYRDNRRAADELLRRRMPASFFIATDFIGSDRVPWWDAESGIVSEWMSWADVRSLRDDGFELGAHTKNHVDLGVVSGPEAVEEIVGSARRLVAETAIPIDLFSYPYGRPHQITEENREIVRNAGFACCPSAYGGTVGKGEDPFRICRTPISPWHISPYQFGFEALLS
ncbi:MAG TPA: polysaccharide deacetylase family protein [Gemmatimonadaceae bacterium]|nr:polysaccharide deacetylase family protein [Gemmatimonadaceae bacterium]